VVEKLLAWNRQAELPSCQPETDEENRAEDGPAEESEELVVEIGLSATRPASEEAVQDEFDEDPDENAETENEDQANPGPGTEEGIESVEIWHCGIVARGLRHLLDRIAPSGAKPGAETRGSGGPTGATL
jgi:hypothetical protein